jgi:hypothetical protein
MEVLKVKIDFEKPSGKYQTQKQLKRFQATWLSPEL